MKAPGVPSVFFGNLNTRFGEISIVWTYLRGANGLLRVFLSSNTAKASHSARQFFPEALSNSGSFFTYVKDILEGVLAGGKTDRPLLELHMSDLKKFNRQVLKQVSRLPRGETATYGEIALAVGSPEAARAVGNVLARNPFPLVIPCHRVISGSGGIGGYQGGGAMKRYLLSIERMPIT